MKRSGFKREAYVRPPSPPPTRGRQASMARISDEVKAAPKANPVRSEAYRRLVAAMPCMRCGIEGYSQCAHGNLGKGMGIKADDRHSFPLCTIHPGAEGSLVAGCHEGFDQGALYSKSERHAIEAKWAEETRQAIVDSGKWPASCPMI